MVISNALKERFCKDYNINIRIFDTPYFENRLELYSRFNPEIKSYYQGFIQSVESCGGENEYFEHYHTVKDSAIQWLNECPEMQFFAKQEDFQKYANRYRGFSSHDIYTENNDGKCFLSFDMKKGNFTALHHYNPKIVKNAETYEDFLGFFTKDSHLLHSKYVRQVIFGNVNPKRQTTYEQYLMGIVLDEVLKHFPEDTIKFFATDEIVLCVDEMNFFEVSSIMEEIVKYSSLQNINIRSDLFVLHKINGISGYIKEYFMKRETQYEIKGVNSIMMPFVLRKFLNEPYQDEDAVFVYEGMLSKLIDIPKIELPFRKNNEKESRLYGIEGC